MLKEWSFNSHLTINSDEDERLVDVLTFPTTFFLSSEASSQSLSNSELANQPITSPRYKFMGDHYSSEYHESNTDHKAFQQKQSLQVDHIQNSFPKKCSFHEPTNNKISQKSQQNSKIDKKIHCDLQAQRNSQEKKGKRVKDVQMLSLPPKAKKIKEKRFLSNQLNGILKERYLISPLIGNPKTQPIFDLFIGRTQNKNVSFQFTIEQIKTMKRNNKSNIFDISQEKNAKLFLI